MYHFSKIFAPTQSEKCFQSCCFHQLLPSSEKSSARKQPLMTTASTTAPASKRLSLHSLPPRQSLPTWLLVDHAFSSFFFNRVLSVQFVQRLPVSRLETLMSRSRRQVTDWRRRRALRRTRDTGSGASSRCFSSSSSL